MFGQSGHKSVIFSIDDGEKCRNIMTISVISCNFVKFFQKSIDKFVEDDIIYS